MPSSRALISETRIRPEPVTECGNAWGEVGEQPGTVARELRCEAKARRRLLRPAYELLLGGNAVAGGVQPRPSRSGPA